MVQTLVNGNYLLESVQLTRKKIADSDNGVPGAEISHEERLEMASQTLARLQANSKIDTDKNSKVIQELFMATCDIYQPISEIGGEYSLAERQAFLEILENADSYLAQPGINEFAQERIHKMKTGLLINVVMEQKYSCQN